MLDLNVEAAVVGVDLGQGNTPTAADSVGSTTTSAMDNADIAAAADEVDCNCSPFTRNFSILGKDVIRIDDDVDSEAANSVNELQLFPMGSSSLFAATASVRGKYWLNLSSPEVPIGGGVELGIRKAVDNPAPQPQAKKSRRGPRSRSSQYRGVTFYRRTGRWESHIWDSGKQVYLGGFDTAHSAARAYDRAAIKFRGVDADINFSVSDYEEDMKQMSNFTKEEFVHSLRRQSTGFSRGTSKFRGASLQTNMGQLLEKKAYEKTAIQRYGREAVTVLEPNNYMKETNFGWRQGGSGSSLDLNLGISPSSDRTDAAPAGLLIPLATRELPETISASSKEMLYKYPPSWAGVFSGFSASTKDRLAAAKTSGEAVPLAGYPNWQWKMNSQAQGVAPALQLQRLPSAASSGFSTAGLNSFLPMTQRPQFPSTAFQGFP